MAAPKGHPPYPGCGRKHGQQNQVTREIRAIATKMLTDPEYMASQRRRLLAGDLVPLELLLHHYAYGKPKDRHEIGGPDGQPIPTKIEVVFVKG